MSLSNELSQPKWITRAAAFAATAFMLMASAHGTEGPVSVSTLVKAISDPFNGEDNPKLIPGAVAEYCVAVENQGPVPVEEVRINVPVPTKVTVLRDTLTLHDAGCGAPPAEVHDAAIHATDGVIKALIDVIAPGSTWSARFRVTID